ncbi:ROK family protein [Methylibium sp.]|uniref:ROK family protein n=1 Tax=Methylibium sp. TaxID=2067992 RepID=UPI00286C2C44|nr:ROK family protein [Methylibium sp.]
MTSAHHAPALGIDLGGTKIEALLLDASGVERWRERVATPQGDYRATLAALARLVVRGRAAASGAACSVGVGAPGSVGSGGLVKNANSTCLNGQALQRDLEALIGQPVALANDANCLALSEATDGAGAGAAVVFAVILGTGVGAGIAVQGRVLQGPNALAGEWGHNPLPWSRDDERPGALCYCGARGCIETWLAGPALAADHLRHGGAALAASDIGRAAAAGDVACDASLARHAERLARALATVVNLLDPDVIVLAGGVSRLHRLVERASAAMPAHIFGARNDPPRLCLALARHGDSSGVRGAAWLGRALA